MFTPKENGQMRTSYISLCYLHKINLGLGVVVGGSRGRHLPPPQSLTRKVSKSKMSNCYLYKINLGLGVVGRSRARHPPPPPPQSLTRKVSKAKMSNLSLEVVVVVGV